MNQEMKAKLVYRELMRDCGKSVQQVESRKTESVETITCVITYKGVPVSMTLGFGENVDFFALLVDFDIGDKKNVVLEYMNTLNQDMFFNYHLKDGKYISVGRGFLSGECEFNPQNYIGFVYMALDEFVCERLGEIYTLLFEKK